MFKNPGKRIKTLARFNFWFLLIGSIVAGIILLCTDYVPIGLPLLLGGPCIAYVENLLLFGFGDLVENSSYLKPKLCAAKEHDTTTSDRIVAPAVPQPAVPVKSAVSNTPDIIICPNCGHKQDSSHILCWKCGTELLK